MKAKNFNFTNREKKMVGSIKMNVYIPITEVAVTNFDNFEVIFFKKSYE